METVAVNWEALDALMLDFAKSENLVDDPSPSPPSSAAYRSRLLIRRVRRAIRSGDLDAAFHLLRLHAPALLDDHRILFRLLKQKFVELLRVGTDCGRQSAIKCLRESLAPCALNAYPEAYEEFKHVLLAFIYDKDDDTSPVANEWSEKRRADLAGLLSYVLRAQLKAYDPFFLMTMKYLISIHKAFCLRQGVASPISDLTERLLLEERDPPVTPQESSFEAPPFDEVDIQALAHAVELTRQGAVDSLKFSRGQLFQAFQNELSRMHLDIPLLDELVHEYCVYRGLVESGLSSQFGSKPLQIDTECNSRDDCSLLTVEHMNSHNSDGETSISSETVSSLGTEIESKYANQVNNNDDCSTSEQHPSETLRRRSVKNRKHVTSDRYSRKRWRGRQERIDISHDLCADASQDKDNTLIANEEDLSKNEQKTSSTCSCLEKANHMKEKYELVLELREMARRGMATEVVDEINSVDPAFFSQNPVLLFQLKQIEFLRRVNDGDVSAALKVASFMGPLAVANPDLMKPLKETLLAFLKSPDEVPSKGVPLAILATSLQVAMGKRLGIEEPQLMKIMRAMVHTHNEWFRLQMCNDRFEGFLKIDCLKDIDASLSLDATSKTMLETCSQGSQITTASTNRTSEDGSSPSQETSKDPACDEGAILKVMEFLALPRADAIHLLGQCNGNAETVIQQIFA